MKYLVFTISGYKFKDLQDAKEFKRLVRRSDKDTLIEIKEVKK